MVLVKAYRCETPLPSATAQCKMVLSAAALTPRVPMLMAVRIAAAGPGGAATLRHKRYGMARKGHLPYPRRHRRRSHSRFRSSLGTQTTRIKHSATTISTSEPRMPPPKITHLQNAALILASGRRGRLHLSIATTRPAYLANHPSFSPDFVCRATPKSYLRLQIKRYFRIENVKAPTHQAKAGAEPQKNQCRPHRVAL